MRRLMVLAAVSVLGVVSARAGDFVGAFDNYSVKVDRSKAAAPRYQGEDAWASGFRTRIKNGLAGGVNFGGRYSMVEIGCGTSCRTALAVDRKTGDIIRFPRGGEDHYSLQLLYRADSRLVQATWADMDKNQCVLEFFEAKAGRFDRVNEFRTARPADDYYCEAN
ncbi:hypothetical protein GCM10011390_50440 [Aureimonas endophytica]|uniref:Uncharacterized protein n=1 Tax=Aureimonas endophytica TaxID=2027858 RepID=A0A917A441_9HYPH|nr:hypothetical protein [Aureimonas endophytica]GGE24910.1 hypothetical protein GCM10011390_50440 [Aureimonas endophytica]